jgi:hypothetical protein
MFSWSNRHHITTKGILNTGACRSLSVVDELCGDPEQDGDAVVLEWVLLMGCESAPWPVRWSWDRSCVGQPSPEWQVGPRSGRPG